MTIIEKLLDNASKIKSNTTAIDNIQVAPQEVERLDEVLYALIDGNRYYAFSRSGFVNIQGGVSALAISFYDTNAKNYTQITVRDDNSVEFQQASAEVEVQYFGWKKPA